MLAAVILNFVANEPLIIALQCFLTRRGRCISIVLAGLGVKDQHGFRAIIKADRRQFRLIGEACTQTAEPG